MTGFEPLIAAATAGVTGIVTGIIKKEGTNVITRWLSQDISKGTQQKIFNASQNYVETYTKRHGLLKVLGMREPVNLDDVYTAVVLLDSAGRRSFSSIDALEKAYRENPRRARSNKEDQKRTGVKVANDTQFLMVLGAPGAGKSTFLRKIGLEALKVKKGNYKHRCLPVLLELKRFTEDQIDIQKFIAKEFEHCGFPNPKGFTEKALKQGRLLILLDGLDEVPTKKRDRVIDTIQDFVDKHDKNRFITSCRVAAYRNNFRRFTDVIMAEFEDGQIEQYINNWFRSEEDIKSGTAKLYWELLKKPENEAAKELAHTPLLLTFLCLVYDRSQSISKNRSTLYRKALRILIEEWAAEKRILREEIYQGLDAQLEEILLAEIAHERFDGNRLFIPQDELVKKIQSFLNTNLNAPENLSGEKVLNAIAIQQGILVERAEDIYSFSHLTLQEYLTARHILAHNQMDTLVDKHLQNNSWREVFLLVIGSMEAGADRLLLSMSEYSLRMVQGGKLQTLLQWVEQIIIQQGNVNNSLQLRVDIIYFALALDHARARVRSLTCKLDYARTNTHDFKRHCTLALDHVRARVLARDLVRDIARDLDRTLTFDRKLDYALGLACARARVLARDLDIDLDRDLGYARARARAVKIYRDFARAFDRDLDQDYARARALDRDHNYTHALASEIDADRTLAQDLNSLKGSLYSGVNLPKLAEGLEALSSQQPGVEEPIEKHLEFVNQILSLQYEIFQLNESILDFEPEDAEVLDSYFYVINLIIQCKKEAIRVSPEAWETVVNRMLVPN